MESVNLKTPDKLSQRVKKIHYLEYKSIEETELVQGWAEKQDPRALNELVRRHGILVRSIANRYRGYGLPIEDLMAEGYVGMMQAVKGFDPEKGFKFSTYARWWIKSAIQHYIMTTWSIVKIGTTMNQKKLFFSLGRLRNTLQQRHQENLSESDLVTLAEQTNIPINDIRQMVMRMRGQDESLNMTIDGGEGSETDWQSLIPDDREMHDAALINHQELVRQQKILQQSLVCLTQRERHVLAKRRLHEPPVRLEELAEEMQLTKQRVHQIELAAFEKLRKEAAKIARAELLANRKPPAGMLTKSITFVSGIGHALGNIMTFFQGQFLHRFIPFFKKKFLHLS